MADRGYTGTVKWWHDKIIYEIYPKSFMDSDGDGTGDLGGIIQKLDYLEDLGVDILWICPCFQSPFVDQGYDISDYYRIDPVFGTNAQIEELIRKAKERGMYVILDLVVNHCSAEHFWFREACRDPEGKYGKYFYIVDAAEEEIPTNWRSYFGGSVWSPLPGNPGKKYLHVFHEKQPDLNWENEEVRREVYSMMKWWLDKGVRGFRVDAIMNIKKSYPLRSYDPDRKDGLVEMETVIGQTRGIEQFLSEMKREVLDPYDAFTVAEVCGEREEDLPLFMGREGFFSSMFDFRETILGLSEKGWYDRKPITLDQYRDTCYAAQRAFNPCGFQTNVIENHDSPRSGDRFLREAVREMLQGDAFTDEEKQALLEKGKKMMAVLYFFLHGIPCIYQGQEIGMENIRLDRFEDIDDVSALGEYGYAIRAGLTREEALSVVQQYSRDNARTPMQWNDTAGCGFTAGTPWIRINPNYSRINVARQEMDSSSILSFYKKMIALRKDSAYRETFVYGSFTPACEEEKNLMAYRRTGEKDILILANIGTGAEEVVIDPSWSRVLLNNRDSITRRENGAVCLEAFQALVLEKTCQRECGQNMGTGQ